MKKFVFLDIVLKKTKRITKTIRINKKKSIIAYDLDQNLLLVSLYSFIPPLRKVPMTLKLFIYYKYLWSYPTKEEAYNHIKNDLKNGDIYKIYLFINNIIMFKILNSKK